MTSEYKTKDTNRTKNKKIIDNNFTELVASIVEPSIENISKYYINIYEEKYKELEKNNKIYENKISCLEETLKSSGETATLDT